MTLNLTLAKTRDATARIRIFEFIAADGAALPAFTAGSHIDLELGNGEERSYSLLNDQGETDRYILGVLREHAGRGGSEWMHDALHVGDTLRSSLPENDFRLSEGGARHILIAGGIGVTPILSMAGRLQALGRDYVIHYCARSRAEAAFVDELSARHGDRACFYFDDGDASRGLDTATLLADRPSATHAYVCGPAGLILAAREAGRNWPVGTVHYELFKGLGTVTPTTDLAFDVILKKQGRTLTVPADSSLLDVLKREGFRIKSLCREGVCGTCRVEVLAGEVDHRDDCLDDDDRDEAMQACVSRAKPGQTLVLDL